MSIIGAVMVPHPPIILPEIGRGEEMKIQTTRDAYEKAMAFAASLQPETVVIASPHSIMYSDYFHISPGGEAEGDFRRFRAGQVRIHADYDIEFVHELCGLCDRDEFPAGTMGEREPELDHGTMIPLYFLNHHMDSESFQVVRIGLSGLSLADHYLLGMKIREAAERLDRRIVFIASGDLSHKLKEEGPYGFDPNGPRYDERIMDVMGRAQFDELLDFEEAFCDRAAECGHRSFVMMAGALDGTGVMSERLSHEGTFGVGYGVCTYAATGPDENRHFLDSWREKRRAEVERKRCGEDIFVRLARAGVESAVRNGHRLPREGILSVLRNAPVDAEQELLRQRAGTFVSIHKNGSLRGCIGTIAAVQDDLSLEIMHNAVSACSEDPRFIPVTEEELPFLDYSVDILGDAEDIDSPDQLDVKRYGVIVSHLGRRGLLLPDLEGVDTVEEQIRIAKRKAGIREDSPCRLQRFEVIRHH
jgi:AmmeMemoRadiSam system protein A